MKNSAIWSAVAIVGAGAAAYFVAKRFGGNIEGAIDGAISTVKETATTWGKKIAAGPGAVTDEKGDRVPVQEQITYSSGLGLKLKPGFYLTEAERARKTGGSFLMTDEEKRAIRAAEAGTFNPSESAKALYDLMTPVDLARLDSFLVDSYNPNTAASMLN